MIKTNFLGNEVWRENEHYSCIACTTIDSVMKMEKKNYPQVYLEEKLSSHFAVNTWAWLTLRYLAHNYLSKFFLVYAHILGWQFWNSFFEGVILKCLNFYSYTMVASGCSFHFKKLLVLDQFSIRLQFWLNLVSSILFVKIKKTKLHRQFFIFLMLYLHSWSTLLNLTFFVLNKIVNMSDKLSFCPIVSSIVAGLTIV